MRQVKAQVLSDDDWIESHLRLSQRHRAWGWNVPMVDIDFLVVEYDQSRPVALIEYKDRAATVQHSSHPSYKALRWLCDQAQVPFYAVRYASNFSWWRVIPVNAAARSVQDDTREMNERRYVEWLYWMRGRSVPAGIIKELGLGR